MKKLIVILLLAMIVFSASCTGAGKSTKDKARDTIPCSDEENCP